MKGEIRRQNILKLLSKEAGPLSATILSKKFGVSRQIIVKDIAKLREVGAAISSLSRGYKLESSPKRVFKIIHDDDDVERELNLIVDLGGKIDDVFVYHKVYSKVSARMDIKSRLDVAKFVSDIANGKSSLLKNVTSGYHYHTFSAQDNENLDIIEEKLRSEGFLAAFTDYEPEEINKF